jgi:hypothetical protein
MGNRDTLTKILTIAGTALVWFPLLMPVMLSMALFISERVFRFDYLIPAELFPVALIGGCLLVWAALRARMWRRLIGWGLGIAVTMLLAGQALAVVTGLASGEIEPAGLWWALVVASLVLYSLSIAAIGIGGVLLFHEVFRSS